MKTLIYFALALIFISCTNKNGRKLNQDICKQVKFYYDLKHKFKKESGQYCKGKKEGKWIEWYKNGKVKWEGNFKSGKRIVKFDDSKKTVILFDGDFQVGSKKAIIINSKGLTNEVMPVGINNGTIEEGNHKDEDFFVTPEKTGTIKFYIYYKDEGFKLNVVDSAIFKVK